MTDKTTSPPPAYFLSLSLENVRSFGDKQTVSFADKDGRPAQWTIILGDNGVGKTTVLKALSSMTFEKGTFTHDLEVRMPSLWRSAYKSWLPFRGLGEDKLRLDTCVIVGPNLSEGVNVEKSKVVASVILASEVSNGEVKKGGINFTSVGNPDQLICYGYGAGRTVGNSTIGETKDYNDTCSSLFDDRADLLNPEEWFLNIDYGSKLAGENAGQLNRARTLVEKMLKTVLPGVTELRIASTGTPQKPQISLQFLLFDTWVRLRDMSLGYQTLVVWLTDFASKLFIRYPDSPNPLEEPAIVLIDEIDLHLHPEWQRKLIGFLSGIFRNTQFIATAHSPLVVQAAGDEGANVVLLRREGDQTVVHQNLEDVRNWRIDQILTSELFGLETARSPEAEQKLKRRAALLSRTKLSATERKELNALTQELGLENQPVGETPSEKQVHAVLQQLREKMGINPAQQGV